MSAGAPLAPTPANLAYAERIAAEIRDRIRLDTFRLAEFFPASGDSGRGDTLLHCLTTWLDAQRIEQSTRKGYESAIRFWAGAVVDGIPLGERPAKAVKPSDLMRALGTKPGLSGKTVNNYVSVARESLQLAVSDGALPTNPAASIPRASYQKEPPDPFTPDEREAIIADLAAHHPGPVHNLVEAWFWTGLRTSEIAAVRWQAYGSGVLAISEALVRGQAKNRTKTNVARLVRLNSRALAAIERQKQHTFLAGGHIFLDPRYGTPWNEERAFRRSFWEPCLKRLGIRYRRPYQMRHTYATQLLMSDLKAPFCAKQMGHSIEVFLGTYSRWLDGVEDDRQMQRLEDSISPDFPQGKEKGPVGP